jgi:hypothetical protein
VRVHLYKNCFLPTEGDWFKKGARTPRFSFPENVQAFLPWDILTWQQQLSVALRCYNWWNMENITRVRNSKSTAEQRAESAAARNDWKRVCQDLDRVQIQATVS